MKAVVCLHLFYISMRENSLQPQLCLAIREFQAQIMLMICLIYHFRQMFETNLLTYKVILLLILCRIILKWLILLYDVNRLTRKLGKSKILL